VLSVPDLLGVVAVAVLALTLVAGVLVYNRWHKGVVWAPVVMGLCRALLPVIGAAIAGEGFVYSLGTKQGFYLLLAAATLWAHTFGLTWVARHEATDGTPPGWTAWALFVIPLPCSSLGSGIPIAATLCRLACPDACPISSPRSRSSIT